MAGGSQPDRAPMGQAERDVLTIMAPVLAGDRARAEAARLLGLTTQSGLGPGPAGGEASGRPPVAAVVPGDDVTSG